MASVVTLGFSLARRFNHVGFSDIVNIRNRVMEMRASGCDVYQFEGGEPFLNTPEPVKAAALRAISENKTRYAPSSGIMELRVALAEKARRRNQIPVRPEDVIVLNGGMQGLFGAFQSIINPGDEVLLFSPFWTPVKDLVAYSGGVAVLLPSAEARENGLLETLNRYCTSSTRAIYYNTPRNPTGMVFKRAEAELVAEFARQRDLIVVADEAYEDLVYGGEHVSMASLPGMLERTITCFTLSKSYAMTGWRIGYALAAEPWMTGLRKSTLYSSNGVSTPTQWAALAALDMPMDYYEKAKSAYLERRDKLVGGLNELGFECEEPAGAFYAFPGCEHINRDSRGAAELLLERAQVATVPGLVFGQHGEGHLRFSFSTSLEIIEAGLDSLRRKL